MELVTMSNVIVTEKECKVNSFDVFKARVKAYANATGADSYTVTDNGDNYSAVVYGLHKVKLFKRPGADSVTAKIYLGERNIKTVTMYM